jgi:hypothetical protein
LQSLLESRDAAPAFRIVRGHVHQHANTLHALGLLRARREWPRSRAAEQRDELAPSYIKHGNFLPGSDAGASRRDLQLRPGV